MALDAQFGQIYNNLQVSGRIDIPTGIPTSYRIVGSLSSFDYLTNGKFFNAGNDPIFNKKDEQFVKLMVSLLSEPPEGRIQCGSSRDGRSVFPDQGH